MHVNSVVTRVNTARHKRAFIRTEWRRLIGYLIFIDFFLAKEPCN